MIDEDDGELALRLLSADGEVVVRFRVAVQPPFGIETLLVDREASPNPLTWDELDATFRELHEEGLFVSAVVHFVRDGEIVLERGYGAANRDLGAPVEVDTVFGIGSTPIDFTVAALLLLDQRGELTLDDSIADHLDEVPDDKASITLRHLITGQSGLPDFHDVPGDWDADLAWIDRDTAVRRILAQPLLFEPGTSRAHSHSAYGLVSAILEIVSGRDYEDFVRAELFEPAGMTRTGMYGQSLGLELGDFAVGVGASSVGVPNIPPNWGPTSWLVLGSGGMASTVPDLMRFYRTMRSGDVLDEERAARFRGETVGVGGSDRGFFLFHAADGGGDEALFLVSGEGRSEEMRELTRRIQRMVMD